MENLQILLRCLGAGDTMIFETPKGKYVAYQCKGTSLIPKGSVEKTIDSRLQFELYGEYPLSEKNQIDYDTKLRKAFNLSINDRSLMLVKNHSL